MLHGKTISYVILARLEEIQLLIIWRVLKIFQNLQMMISREMPPSAMLNSLLKRLDVMLNSLLKRLDVMLLLLLLELENLCHLCHKDLLGSRYV